MADALRTTPLTAWHAARGARMVPFAGFEMPVQYATGIQEELSFPVAYGVTQDQAAAIGGWWEDRRSIIQPSEFILDRDGRVVSATYSTGPVGRLMPEDAAMLIKFVESQKSK